MIKFSTITLATALLLTPIFTTYAHDSAECASSGEATDQHAGHGNKATIGKIELTEARARAMLTGQKVGGGYLTIKNTGSEADRLIAVSTPNASRTELHEMAMVDGVMKMRKLQDGLEVKAGETIKLAPGGHHLMFFGIEKPFSEGEKIPVELSFEKAGKVTLELITTPASNSTQMKHH